MRAEEAVASVMRRLDDEEGVVWPFEEILLYVKDGYDKFCRTTKCLFDIHVVENIPRAANWTTDLERYIAENTPGMNLTDERLGFTATRERDQGLTGQVGGNTTGPSNISGPGEAANLDAMGITSLVDTATLPEGFADVLRVTWDELELKPEGSAQMRVLDKQYERREGGDPRHYTMDKDGLFTIRLVPPARADAVYDDVDGAWGSMSQTSDTNITTSGTWGIFIEADGHFPANGPWGTPTRRHPSAKNILVEMARLGKKLDAYPFEVPYAYIKFIIFWAMHRALKKNGVGQDLKLSKHFADRFEMGLNRLMKQLRDKQKEHVLMMGTGPSDALPFDLGEPQLPFPYGPKGRNIR